MMLVSAAFDLFIEREILGKNKSQKTADNYKTGLRAFTMLIDDVPVEFIEQKSITVWVQRMQGYPYQDSTMNTNLQQLRSVIKFCGKTLGLKVMDWRDIESVKEAQKDRVWLEPDEVAQMIDATDSVRDKAIIACLFSTGCRVSELLNLNREDIIDGKATVLGKGSKFRPVWFSPKALGLLQDYLDTRKDRIPALFVSGQYRRITVGRVQQLMHVITADAGIDKIVTPHVMRHSFASAIMNNGANEFEAMEMLGHANIATTQIYVHTNEKRLADVHRRVAIDA